MPDRSRVPGKIHLFDSYIVVTDNHLRQTPAGGVAGWQRLGLSSDDADQWHAYRDKWDKLFRKYSSSDTRTGTVAKAMKNLRKEFKKFSRRGLNQISMSAQANDSDAVTFNTKLLGTGKKPSRREAIISEQAAILAHIIGGGEMRFTIRSIGHHGRARLVDGADSVELVFKIGEPPLTDSDAATHRIINTGARFVYDFGLQNIGKYVYAYARWYNTRHPKLAGPWSGLAKVMIA